MSLRGWRLLPACWLVLMFLAGAGGTPAGNWQVVLAAGDDAQPVFDNAVAAMAAWLEARGVPAADIHRLSASPAQVRDAVEPATLDNVLSSIAELPVRPGDRCLVFLTSHGEHGEGLWLARSRTALHPAALARALAQGCGAAPTVVIVSGCYSGGFAHGEMTRSNRVIMTAARADRPSFGCQAERTYTFFDQCLLATLPKSATWRTVFAGTKKCVSRMERVRGERPSDPQAYFGRAADLKMLF
ncbi:MAG TPA: C13 family peptidase [Stellaceae bacterium]|jgi:hypothetical protein